MTPSPLIQEEIHSQAVAVSQRYRKNESELIEIIQKVEEHRVFLKYGYSSLFIYVTGELKLSESVAYNLIAVARKAREVPELKNKIQEMGASLLFLTPGRLRAS